MLFYIYSDSTGSTIDITSRCRLGRLSVRDNAEEGSVAISSLIIDDPSGDLLITGHRRMYIYESAATAFDQVIFNGFVVNERVSRGPYKTGAGRIWTVDLADCNVLINRRIMNGADANRPAETDIARISALLLMTELNTVDDALYFNLSAATTAMDAVDYRGQNVGAYIDDCRQASGKNAYIWYRESVGQFSLWYDFARSTAYDSGVSLSNTLADINQTTVFQYSEERTYLNRDPSRVASGVYLEYDGGSVYVQNAATTAEFAAIDFAAPSVNVKSLAKATARANRYLGDATDEEDVIHTVMTAVPRAKVNVVKKGQLLGFKASHLPGYETTVPTRILYKQTMEITEDLQASYEIEMDLSPNLTSCSSQVALIQVYDSGTSAPTNVPFSGTLSNPPEYPATLLAFWIGALDGTDIGYPQSVSAPWTFVDGYAPVLGGRHINMGIASLDLASGSPSATTVTWDGHFSTEVTWRMLGFSIGTATLVQQGSASGGGTVTLPGAPTPGNLLSMFVVGEDAGNADTDLSDLVAAGWSVVGAANLVPGSTEHGSMGVLVKCVTAADTDEITVPGPSYAHWAFVQEWAFT